MRHRPETFACFAILFSLATLAKAGPASAADQASRRVKVALTKGSVEWGILAGGGIAHAIWGGRSDRQFLQLGGRLGYVLSNPILPGPLRGNLELALEALPAFVMLQERTTYGVSTALVFRHLLARGSRIRPTLSWGAGILYTGDETPPGTHRLNFTPQIGVGFDYFLRDTWAVSFEYRLHHISNAGLAPSNPGINSTVFQVGLVVLSRRKPGPLN
jgi:hypothetical protein